ncbi:AlkA N-terminal domain-containing protein [Salininema proteolyticum]|uniref:DNA-3-methyladenine glycosylase II n=1 Tax=Salininema proteolyticum TaxID=1607685 RepID=A0ABV8TVI1_9ACTN
MQLDTDYCLRAVESRDSRFDGWFYTAVSSTGIYCRPSCPAQTPKPENMSFYPTAAGAQQAGYRACKRCRPDATPGSPEWNYRSDVAARGMRLIREGVVDRDGVPGLARRLGYSVRQLERHFQEEFGAGPKAMARAQRAQTARVLIETTPMAFTEIAFAAGFTSLRSFNDTIGAVFNLTPTLLRERSGKSPTADAMTVRLPFREPLHPDNLFGHLAATGTPGVEDWSEGYYRRTARLPHGPGRIAVRPRHGHIECRLELADMRDASVAINRVRWMLDLDADPSAVDGVLSADEALAPLVRKAPGRRVPRNFDAVEMALKAVIGQQISTKAARTQGRRLAEALGERLSGDGGPGLLYPTAEAVAASDLDFLPVTRRTKATLRTLADAVATGTVDLGPGTDWHETRARLLDVPGVGPWTADVIAMRALGDPDVLLPGDLGVKGAAQRLGLGQTKTDLEKRSRTWAPWRSYAVQHLWATADHPVNDLPEG